MCTGSKAFRASPEPGLSREVNSSLGRACLSRASPASIMSAAQRCESPRPELRRRWLGECLGWTEVGLDGSASHLICLSSSRRVQRICMGVMEMNEWDIIPAQEDTSRWGLTEIDRWLNCGVTIMEEVSYINCLRPRDMLAQAWWHLSPLLSPAHAKLGNYDSR